MAAPVVIFDPSMDLPKITHNLYLSGGDGPDPSVNSVDQTMVDGIVMPLIRLNNMSLNFAQVSFFELSSVEFVPRLRISIKDSEKIMKIFNKTEADNYIQVQILPPFDGAYRKINMVFYVVNHETHGDRATFDCIYKAQGFRDSRLESFGELTTFELFEKIAGELGLGFVSNVKETHDKRWIYCDNCSFQDLIKREMDYSGTATEIFDSWIDFRNNLTLLDIYERQNTIDENLTIWTTRSKAVAVSNEFGDINKPVKVPATLTNHYTMRSTPLYIARYENIMNSEGSVINGTDEVSICYSFDNSAEDNMYLADGSIESDTTIKYKYVGEYFGTFNYLTQQRAVKKFKDKINKDCISVTLHTICLGLMRGDKVNIRWYEGSTTVNDAVQKNNKDYESNIPTGEDDPNSGYETQVINKAVSGQYLIKDIIISYKDATWNQKLTLIKVKGDIEMS